MVLHRMRIGQDPPSSDDKPTATRAVLPLPLPQQREIRLRVNAKYLHHRVHRRHHLNHRLPLHLLRNANCVLRCSSYRCCCCIDRRRVGEVAVLVSVPWAAAFGWNRYVWVRVLAWTGPTAASSGGGGGGVVWVRGAGFGGWDWNDVLWWCCCAWVLGFMMTPLSFHSAFFGERDKKEFPLSKWACKL